MPEGTKVLSLFDLLSPDDVGSDIALKWSEWDMGRAAKKAQWKELREYIFATDTTTTSNAATGWQNKTTMPKLTQIRDNLYANYMASMFPNSRWMEWIGDSNDDNTPAKRAAIKAYMTYVIEQPMFKDTISKLVLDYIDYGNCFSMPIWVDQRAEPTVGMLQYGYVGPSIKRISPLDIVMNPTSPSVYESPKIIRSIVTLGDVKEMLARQSKDEGEQEAAKELYNYLRDVRTRMSEFGGDLSDVTHQYSIDGFTSFQHYLTSGYVEVLTFYGDLYDFKADEFYKNHIIQVVDRHKVIRKEPNPTIYGYPPIFHCGWRPRQDNLWSMGPLDNLVGLQYRLDHIENLKADLFDLTTFPPLKVKGYVEPFTWAPLEKISVSEEGDVELMRVDVNPLSANFELDALERKMEELAGAPKEAMGFRTPGEKTMYEVQRLENAAARVFQAKIAQFEEQKTEPLLNAMLDLARRNMDATTVRVLNDDQLITTFQQLTPEDITGSGRIRPWAARHFVEVSQRIQEVTGFYGSPIGLDQEVRQHISPLKLAKLAEDLLDLENFKLVEPYIRLTEQAESAKMTGTLQQEAMMALQTPSGIGDDTDENALKYAAAQGGPPQGPQGPGGGPR